MPCLCILLQTTPSKLPEKAEASPKQLLTHLTLQVATTATSVTPKWLLPWGEGKINTHQIHCSPSSRWGTDIWSDSRPQPLVKAFQGTMQGQCPIVRSDRNSKWAEGRYMVWPNYKPKAVQDCPPDHTGTKPCSQQTKWVTVANFAEGKYSRAITLGHTQPT